MRLERSGRVGQSAVFNIESFMDYNNGITGLLYRKAFDNLNVF